MVDSCTSEINDKIDFTASGLNCTNDQSTIEIEVHLSRKINRIVLNQNSLTTSTSQC